MKNVILSFAIFFGLIVVSGNCLAQIDIYSEVTVQVPNSDDIQRLAELDFDIDHYQGNPNEGISFFVNQDELARLSALGFNFEVTVPNYIEQYKAQQLADQPNIPNMTRSEGVANGFDLGSMGGFYTLAEVGAKLDEMKNDFPNLITAKASIGTSVEGRDIWMAKISDNPDIDEPEPSAYFDALHHAREPLAMAVTINYMFWLLENYDTNAEVKWLVDNRELYFVPVVNPDGYFYNEQIEPNGGGLWRKNRRANGGGCFGVDLNRNYSFGYANNGSCSSTNPCSGTYRGTGAFSEPEAVAVRDFLALVEPSTGFSTHSTAGTFLMPYGYDTSPPDFEIYSEWASSFLDENDYDYGVTFQMLGYTSCGTTRDYFHSEGIYVWTPEIGGSGFWPNQSTIFDLVAENIRPMFYQSWISGAYLDVQSHSIIGNVVPGQPFEMVVELKNVGVGATAQNVSVVVESSTTGVTVPTASTYGTIAARARKDNSSSPFQFFVDPSFSQNSFTLTISTYQDGTLNETMEIPVVVSEKDILFYDDAESGAGNWTASGSGIQWGVVQDDAYSGTASFGDSDGGNGENNTNNFFVLDEVFDFTLTSTPFVSFVSKYSISDGDNVRFQISTNGGSNWTDLETYTRNEKWHVQNFNLLSYQSFSDVRFRFRLQNDGSSPGDGFYFDDFEVANYDEESLGAPQFEDSLIAVYPNPFSDIINIELGNVQVLSSEIAVYDIAGRKIAAKITSDSNVLRIENLSGLTSGMYFLKFQLEEDENYLVKKIVKK